MQLICGTTPDGQRVAQKNVGVAAETDDTFLNARAAGIVQPNNRRADLHRQVHHLADFFGVSFGKGTAKDCEVLREDKHLAAVDQAVAGDNAIAGIFLFVQTKIARAMLNQLVEFFERARHQAGNQFVRARSSCRRCVASQRAPRRHLLRHVADARAVDRAWTVWQVVVSGNS